MSAIGTDPVRFLCTLVEHRPSTVAGFMQVRDTAARLVANGRVPRGVLAALDAEIAALKRERMGAVFGLEAKADG